MAAEITLQEALKTLLVDEETSDVTWMNSNDGTLVRANREMLAAQSVVFPRMLYGDFAEAQQSVVNVGFTGNVLHSIVEYIHTNTLSFLESDNFDRAFVRTTVSLIDAAKYYELPVLVGKCF
jgi:hypothetical protein